MSTPTPKDIADMAGRRAADSPVDAPGRSTRATTANAPVEAVEPPPVTVETPAGETPPPPAVEPSPAPQFTAPAADEWAPPKVNTGLLDIIRNPRTKPKHTTTNHGRNTRPNNGRNNR